VKQESGRGLYDRERGRALTNLLCVGIGADADDEMHARRITKRVFRLLKNVHVAWGAEIKSGDMNR
jgi:hypothetical protein